MFKIGQTVVLGISSSLNTEETARVVHVSPAHLILELSGKTLPPIDTDATITLDLDGRHFQQLAKVSGHWQHSPRATVEFARLGKPKAVERQLGAA